MTRNWSNVSYLRPLLIAIVFLASSVASGEDKELSIYQTLAEAQFNTVHMPPESMLLSKYGEGQAFVRDDDIYHVYYLADAHLWLRCKSMGDDKLYKPVSEILISGIDLGGDKIAPESKIEAPHLKGIRVGDNVAKALKQWGRPLRKYPQRLGLKSTTVFEFFPTTLVRGSCVRFFVRDSTILGFAFSSEE